MSDDYNLPTVIVIPCLNEEHHLLQTCISLGFGTGISSSPKDSYLVIVDNGSTDNTLTIAQYVVNNSPPKSVIIGYESERGYVPPRHKGNVIAENISRENGWKNSTVLILQADADTLYSPNYILEMQKVSIEKGENVLVESLVQFPKDFIKKYPEYVELCKQIDHQYEELFTDYSNDVIVDDKACGYRLGFYLEHGGHQREFTKEGEEIHAETSRLYMRFKSQGGTRARVENAFVEHSTRKIEKNPLLEMATAGFPREKSWYLKWGQILTFPMSLDEFYTNIHHPNVSLAANLRSYHLLCLFSILPAHFHKAVKVNKNATQFEHPFVGNTVGLLPKRTFHDANNFPARLIVDVLSLFDESGDKIIQLIQ